VRESKPVRSRVVLEYRGRTLVHAKLLALGPKAARYRHADLARMFGCSRERIRQVVNEFDLPYKPRNNREEHPIGYGQRSERDFLGAMRAGIDRLVALTDERGPNECWRWMGSYRVGRPTLFHGQPGRSRYDYAQRAAYERYRGSIPPRHNVVHTCGHRWCVNPRHLKAESYSATIRRMVRNRRSIITSPFWSTLTPAKVKYIRREYAKLVADKERRGLLKIRRQGIKRLTARLGYDPRFSKKIRSVGRGTAATWLLP